jgi:MFS family permease
MRTFLVVWAGQLVSTLGSTMTAFAVEIWVYTETRSVTNLAMISLAYSIPQVIASPFAGAMVDRHDRRRVMIAADLAAAAATAALFALYTADLLAIGHIVAVAAVLGVTGTFQGPAWMASISLLVPKAQLGRANGLVQLTGGVTAVLAPLLAGVALALSGLELVLVLDLATFAVAVTTLAVVRLPRPAATAPVEKQSLLSEAGQGWRFVRERPGLLGLLWTVGGVNFALTFFNVLLVPLVVALTTSQGTVGAVLSVASIGSIVGSLAVSAWGGPRRKVLAMMATIGVVGGFVTAAGLRPSVGLVAASCFVVMAVVPITNTASQVIWQTKVPPAMQGRVFAIRRMISEAITPAAFLLAGPLADGVFEPLLQPGGGLAGTVGAVIGTGDGRGIGFMYVLTGLLMVTLALIGWARPRVRNLEEELPDQIEEEVMSLES